jgi:hypothetical protein
MRAARRFLGSARSAADAPGQRGRRITELLHEAEPVRHAPVLHDPTVHDADDVDDVDPEQSARCWGAHERSLVCAGRADPRPHVVTVHDRRLDGEVEVGERAPKVPDRALHALAPGLDADLALDVVGGNSSSIAARSPWFSLLDRLPEDGGGLGCRGRLDCGHLGRCHRWLFTKVPL